MVKQDASNETRGGIARNARCVNRRLPLSPASSLMLAILISSCASGDEPIEPSVSSGNSALIRAEFEASDQNARAAQANKAALAGAATSTSTGASASTPAEASGQTLLSSSAVATTSEREASASTDEVTTSKGALATFAADALAAINAARAQARYCGDKSLPAVGPLVWNARAAYAAMLETEWMQSTNSFGHIWPSGERVWDRLQLAGYAWQKADENIAAGFRTLDAAMQGWIDSPPHCVALMRADITEVGVSVVPGLASNTYLSYWAMVLATPQAGSLR